MLSYVVGAGERCVVIDPSTDIERYLAVARARGWRISFVVDTHLHADHVSGARLLAEAADAALVLSDRDAYAFAVAERPADDVLELERVAPAAGRARLHPRAHDGLDHARARRAGPLHR